MGKTLLEGPHLLVEALTAGEEVIEVFCLPTDEAIRELCEQHGVPFTLVSPQVLARIADTKTPRGPVAVMTIPMRLAQGRDVLWLMVSEPGNCGTLIRTAGAFGWNVAMANRSVDPWAPKVLRAGAGGHFRVSISQVREAPENSLVVASVPRGGIPLEDMKHRLDYDQSWWLVVGDESGGVPATHIEGADLRCSIPMASGTESLNAAVAGAIICHHLSSLRTAHGQAMQGRPSEVPTLL
jgi:TrmH family RNA methyltransferase